MLPSYLAQAQSPQNLPGTNTETPRGSISHGTEFGKNGKHYRVSIVPDESRYFVPPVDMSEQDIESYDRCFAHLRDAAQVASRMTNVLCDSRRGETTKGASLLADQWELVDSPYKTELAAHLLCILRQGDVMHDKLQSVIVPPCSRQEFEKIILGFPEGTFSEDFDWDSWLNHLYDAQPRVAEGFIVFATPQDEEQFFKALGEDYAERAQKVQSIFDKAIEDGGLSDPEWKEYNRLSQGLCEDQKKLLDSAIKNVPGAKDLSTAAIATVAEDGSIICTFSHYTKIFEEDLKELQALLIKAANELPESSVQTKAVLEAQADWCTNSNSNDPDWARSLPIWLTAVNPEELLDINVTCEEVHGSFGKGTFHLAVCQHDETPEALKKIAPIIEKAGKENGIAFLFLRTLITGGHNEQVVVSGEKLPDPENQPAYKSMTFTNTSGTVQIQSYAASISAALGLTTDEVISMSWVGPVWVYLHEYGHTLGGVASYTDRASDVEETNAQASAAYLSARYFPESHSQLQNFGVPWTAIRRTQQGPTEMHSRSDLVLIREYIDGGAVEIVDIGDEKAQLQIVDSQLLTEIAFRTALKMRMWEAGLPATMHEEFAEKFDPTQGEEQDARIKLNVAEYVRNLDEAQLAAYQKVAAREIEKYFANERLNEIGDSLAGVLRAIPSTQPLSVMPTNRSVRTLLGLTAA